MSTPVLVSSCLLGLATKYDGTDNYNQAVIDYLKRHKLLPIPICPEQLAGSPTPRPKCWFTVADGQALLIGNGKICNESGTDVSNLFMHGAYESLKLARICNCQLAILKQRSPSCGTDNVHQNGKLVNGMGVTAALLRNNGLQLLNEENLPPA